MLYFELEGYPTPPQELLTVFEKMYFEQLHQTTNYRVSRIVDFEDINVDIRPTTPQIEWLKNSPSINLNILLEKNEISRIEKYVIKETNNSLDWYPVAYIYIYNSVHCIKDLFLYIFQSKLSNIINNNPRFIH